MADVKKVNATEHWQKTLIPAHATLQQTIRNLEESSLQISLVVNPEGNLLGTITDGDIRRGLLNGLSLNSSIETIIYRDPFVVHPQLGRDTVLQLMRANKIHQLPIVDENRCVIGLHLWDELIISGSLPNLMVIMAGGKELAYVLIRKIVPSHCYL